MSDVQAHGDGDRPRPLVLVVDDEEAIRMALDRSLKKMGYDVLLTDDGNQALELARTHRPVLILSDIFMPGMDGHTLLANINRLGLMSSVVLMSGRGELDDAISALREGAVDYMKKPWTPEGLTGVLRRAMGLAAALQDLATGRDEGGPPGATPEATAMEVIEQLVQTPTADLPLPEVSPTLTRLRALARTRERSPADVAAFVESDPEMKAAILRMAQAQPEHATAGPELLRTVLEALGVEAAWGCVEAAVLRDAFPIATGALRTLADRIWRFSVARAIAMQELALIADAELELSPLLYFQAGLLLDVGASYLLSAADRALVSGGGRITEPAKLLATITAHHAAVTARIIRRWNLPTALEELAAEHHRGSDIDPRLAAEPLWCAARLGGAMAVRVTGFGDPTGDRMLGTDQLARCAYTLGVGDSSLRRLTKSLTERAHQTWVAFG
jgi:CheY-like chemotaxis protein/HD-like signal output (HDOD) protein